MCGINGLFLLRDSSFNIAAALHASLNTIRHRGPDGEGYVLFDTKTTFFAFGDDTPSEIKRNSNYNSIESSFPILIGGMGHRRLSIIDLSLNGHQPMTDESGNYAISFNGEIYNYRDIKKQLLTLGYSFKSNTDSEVVLYAYMEWKEKCLELFDGMWAFSIYSKKERTLFISRDRVGVKPLYYVQNADFFAFASEIKALLKINGITKKLNKSVFASFLLFNELEKNGQTLYEGINEILPGHYYEIDLDKKLIKHTSYFRLLPNLKKEKFNDSNFSEHSAEIKKLLFNAVDSRCVADVEVASCLSGGLDSSAIVSIMHRNKLEDKNHKVFTLHFPNHFSDETKWAEIVTKEFKLDWIKVQPDFTKVHEELPSLIDFQDNPLLSLSTYAQYCLMQEIKAHKIKVVLDGQGGDELFGGYRQHQLSWQKENLGGNKETLKHDLKQLILKLALKNKSLLFRIYPELKLINPDLLDFSELELEKYYSKKLNTQLHKDYYGGYLKSLLRWEDRNSMAHSIEARTPFSDDNALANYLFKVSGVYKIDSFESKKLLRSSMKGVVPPEILKRKDKMGLQTPNNEWMKKNSPLIDDSIQNNKSGVFSKSVSTKNSRIIPKNDKETYRHLKYYSLGIWANGLTF